MLDAVSNMASAILKSLKAGLIHQRHLRVEFSLDVFRFLFDGKGTKVPRRSGKLYCFEDFDERYFNREHFEYYNSHDEGCKVKFPLYMNSCLRWGPKSYNSSRELKKRDYTEILIIYVTKFRC